MVATSRLNSEMEVKSHWIENGITEEFVKITLPPIAIPGFISELQQIR